MSAFEKPVLPVLNKAAFPLGLACNYGIDSDGVRAAVDAGVNYLFWPGMRCKPALAGVRDALAKDRDKMILAAGTGGPFGFHFRSRVEALLKQLGTDYLDVFQMFWLGVTSWDTRSVMDALLELKEEGKIRAIGVTLHDRARAGRLAADSELDMLQVRYSAAHPGAERDIFPHLADDRRFLVGYTSTSWGKLLKAPEGYAGEPATAADCYRFCLSHPAISVVISGPKTRAELEENLAGLTRGPMSDDELARMRALGAAVAPGAHRAPPVDGAHLMVPSDLDAGPVELRALDFSVRRFDGYTLEIAGGAHDQMHTHPSVLLRLQGVSYVDCPTAFRHARFRPAAEDERHALERRTAVDEGARVYAIDAEALGHVEPQTFFVVAHHGELLAHPEA